MYKRIFNLWRQTMQWLRARRQSQFLSTMLHCAKLVGKRLLTLSSFLLAIVFSNAPAQNRYYPCIPMWTPPFSFFDPVWVPDWNVWLPTFSPNALLDDSVEHKDSSSGEHKDSPESWLLREANFWRPPGWIPWNPFAPCRLPWPPLFPKPEDPVEISGISL